MVAEVAGVLVDLLLRLRLATLVVIRRVVKGAVQATMQITVALQAGIAAADAFDLADVVERWQTRSIGSPEKS